MRKNIILLTAAACMFFCQSCSSLGESYAVSESYIESTETAGMNEKNEMTPEEWKVRLSKTEHITISDVFAQMYEPELQIKLTDDDVRKFISLGDSLELSEGNLRMEHFYKLTMTDGFGEVIDEWVVDAGGNIVNKEDRLVKGENLEAWRNEIEREHEITYSLLSRAPGKEYFSLLSMAATGHLSENTVDPAMEGVEYELSETELRELMALEYEINSDSERVVEPDIYYMLHIYDENGAGLYSFSADHEGMYLCNQYPVSGKGLESFFHELEKKNKL